MTKLEFCSALRKCLSGLPGDEVEARLDFYTEMIDDRMEDGCSEEEAVLAVGSVDAIAAQILEEIPLTKIVRERLQPKRRLKAWEIVLLALGSPIWISLLAVAAAVVVVLYAGLWAAMVSLWACFAALAGSAFGGIAAGIVFACKGHIVPGIALIGAGIFCAGLTIFWFCGCKKATAAVVQLTRLPVRWMKNRIRNRRMEHD